MTKVIQAPHPFLVKPNERKLFLAGGITGVRDWQSEMIGLLQDIDNLLILNPRRIAYKEEDVFDQISWEFWALSISDIIMFWFSNETVQPITLFELGKWCGRDKEIIVGCHPEYTRRYDVGVQLFLERGTTHIPSSLEELSKIVRRNFK